MRGVEIVEDGGGKRVVIEGTDVRTAAVREVFMEGALLEDICASYDPPLEPNEAQAALRYECCSTCRCDDCAWARSLRAEVEAEASPIVTAGIADDVSAAVASVAVEPTGPEPTGPEPAGPEPPS